MVFLVAMVDGGFSGASGLGGRLMWSKAATVPSVAVAIVFEATQN